MSVATTTPGEIGPGIGPVPDVFSMRITKLVGPPSSMSSSMSSGMSGSTDPSPSLTSMGDMSTPPVVPSSSPQPATTKPLIVSAMSQRMRHRYVIFFSPEISEFVSVRGPGTARWVH